MSVVTKKYFFMKVPAMDEFIFQVIKYSSDEAKLKLSPGELFMIRDDIHIRKFAVEQGMERKAILLTKLGIKFHWVFYPEGMDFSIFDKILGQWESGEQRVKVMKEMAEAGLFVMGSKDVMNAIQFTAMDSTSGGFVLNYDYVRLGEYLKKVRGQIITGSISDAEISFEWLSKLMGRGLSIHQYTESIAGVEPLHMQILLVLYPSRDTYVTVDKILSTMQLSKNNMTVKNACRKMQEGQYVHKHLVGPKSTAIAYTIQEKGIEAVTKYLKYLINSSLYG